MRNSSRIALSLSAVAGLGCVIAANGSSIVAGLVQVAQPVAALLNATVTGKAANGSAVSGNPVLVCGSDGTNCRSLLVDASGRVNVNQSQWSGSTVDTNSGAKSAGTLRVVIATDQPAFSTPLPVALNGFGTNGAASPIVACDSRTAFTAAAQATTLFISGVNGKNIYICGFSLAASVGSSTFKFVSGTGATCGTGQSSSTGAYTMATASSISYGSGLGVIASTSVAGDSLCMTTTGPGATMSGVLSFTVF